MSKKIIVIGAGAHSRVIIDILNSNKSYQIVGIIDSVLKIGETFYGYKIIGRQNQLEELANTNKFSGGIIAIGDNYLREKLSLEIKTQIPNFDFVNAISPFTSISKTITLGKGNVIMPGVIINSEASLGNHCIINTNSSLEHNCKMDDFSSISAGVVTGGYVEIGKYTAIALGVTVLDRLKIGENVVVGSGALVINNLDSNYLYYGVPANKIRPRTSGEKFLK